MTTQRTPLTSERRTFLALKGRLLYGKYCGTDGQGICAENFAIYHLQRDEGEVVAEFLAFLELQIADLRRADPERRMAMTESLAARIRRHLESATPTPEDSWPGP